MFELGGRLMLVDLPGYGFAEAPKAKVDAWQQLIRSYLRGRAGLIRTSLLIDARHGPKPVDVEFMAMLGEVAVAYQLVLTKVDLVRQGALADLLESLRADLARRLGAHPDIIATSAREGIGIERLRAVLTTLAMPPSGDRQ
jgi:GTP-binding protein